MDVDEAVDQAEQFIEEARRPAVEVQFDAWLGAIACSLLGLLRVHVDNSKRAKVPDMQDLLSVLTGADKPGPAGEREPSAGPFPPDPESPFPPDPEPVRETEGVEPERESDE